MHFDNSRMKMADSRRTSSVWNYFTIIGSCKAKCKICEKKLSYRTSVTNLKCHIIRKHSLSDLRRYDKTEASVIKDEELEVYEVDTVERDLYEEVVIYDIYPIQEQKISNSEKPQNSKKDDQFIKSCPASFKVNKFAKFNEYDAVAVNVSKKLQRMNEIQSIYAECIIERILLRGLNKTLTCNTYLSEDNSTMNALTNDDKSYNVIVESRNECIYDRFIHESEELYSVSSSVSNNDTTEEYD